MLALTACHWMFAICSFSQQQTQTPSSQSKHRNTSIHRGFFCHTVSESASTRDIRHSFHHSFTNIWHDTNANVCLSQLLLQKQLPVSHFLPQHQPATSRLQHLALTAAWPVTSPALYLPPKPHLENHSRQVSVTHRQLAHICVGV